MTNEQIARINALAKKSREEGLSAEETAEQAALRAEYVAAIRKNLSAQLEQALITDEAGNQVPLRKKSDPKQPS